MSRTLLIVSVCLGAYCVLDLAVSAFVALIWRTRAVAPAHLPPRVRARRLFLFRLVPAFVAGLMTLAIVGPAFALFEPPDHGEALGPAMAALAGVGMLQLAATVFLALRSAWLTRRFEREWLPASEPIESITGLRAFAVQASTPFVALVGVFAPKLIAARCVLDACSPDEVTRILAHERGHMLSRDNLKRWVMSSLPDALRWTPIHREIVDAWHHAAEDAADDAATGGEAAARADLAALVLKIVRLTPHLTLDTAVVSRFVEDHGLERRVRRLLQPETEPPAPWAVVPTIAAVAIGVGIAGALASPDALKAVFEAFETLVALGR